MKEEKLIEIVKLAQLSMTSIVKILEDQCERITVLEKKLEEVENERGDCCNGVESTTQKHPN